MTLCYSCLEIKVKYSVAPIFKEYRLKVNIKLLHPPDELRAGVSQWVHLTVENTRLGKLRQDMGLELDRRGYRVREGVADAVPVQRDQREQKHVFRQKEVIKAKQD